MSEQSNTPSPSAPWARQENEAWQQAIHATKEVEQLYNQILTAVDHALKIPPLEDAASNLKQLRSQLNDLSQLRGVFRKDTGPRYSLRWWLNRMSPLFWFRKLAEKAVSPVLIHQQAFNSTVVQYLTETADQLASANQRLTAVHQLLGAFFVQITPWIDVKIREIRSEENYNIAHHYGSIIHSHIHKALQDYNDLLQKQLHGLFVLVQPVQILEQQTIQIQRELEDLWHGVQKVDEVISRLFKRMEDQRNQAAQHAQQLNQQIQATQQGIQGLQEIRQLVQGFDERYFPTIRVEPFELDRIRNEVDQLKNHVPPPMQPQTEYGRPAKPWEFPKSRDLRYLVFEEVFRGSSEWLKKKIQPYVDIFRNAPEPILDVGCGRGEFLELMREIGKNAYGVEMNQHETEQLRKRGIRVLCENAITHVAGLDEGSIGGVFCAQVVEHLTPEDVYQLVSGLQSKMKTGAPLVIETINPLSIQAFHSFYLLDPTHIYPVHPQTLVFFLRYAGFTNVQVRKITPFPPEAMLANPDQIADGDTREYLNALVQRLNSILYDSAEYFVLGYKK